MLRRIKNRLLQPLHRKRLILDLCEKLNTIRGKSDVLVIYGAPTKTHYLGIANATRDLYPENVLEIPQSYSNAILSDDEIIKVCQQIKELKFEKVIVSGFAQYFFKFIDELYTSCQIETLYHGTISEFHSIPAQYLIESLILYGQEKKIYRMGFVKQGLEKVFSELYGFDTFYQPLKASTIPPGVKLIETDPTKIHIGVLGNNNFNKNLHNQVIYALMNKNTVVHVLDENVFNFMKLNARIIAHGRNLSRMEFLGILGAMDLNLYMSYSESHGLVAYESEAMGVPCLRLDDVDYYTKISTAINKKQVKE
ncbi:MAG: hypothetical protein JWO03_3380 [Bacteroidetes bacterium]|nr:hypothetical protein [Bacteroidota bacterium]